MRRRRLLFLWAVYLASMAYVGSPAAQPLDDLAACRAFKKTEGAIEACTRAIQDPALPNPARAELLVKRAHHYNLNRQRELAEPDYTTAIELNPGNIEARRRRGMVYADRRDFERALPDFAEAIRLGPDDAESYRQRGHVRVLQRAFDGAIEDYRKAIALNPKGFAVSLATCQISASLFAAFFNCTGIAFDTTQPADSRAEARARLDKLRQGNKAP